MEVSEPAKVWLLISSTNKTNNKAAQDQYDRFAAGSDLEVTNMNSAQVAKNMEKRVVTMEKLCRQMGIRYLGAKEELF